MYESLTSDTFYDFDDKEMYIQFANVQQTYLQFKKCVNKKWTSRYFFNEVIDPDSEFDDGIVNDELE